MAGRAPVHGWRGHDRRASLPALMVAAFLALAVFCLAHPLRAFAALPPGCTQAGLTVTCAYASTGSEQTFTVPAGTTSVQVTAIGAAGGKGNGSAPGGQGAEVIGTLTGLTSGETLYVEVGGAPTNAGCYPLSTCVGGFNGGGSTHFGGGGGGASDVRTEASAVAGSLATRLIVAAGGGGAGEAWFEPCDPDSVGTPGGNAGAAGGGDDCAGVGTSTGGGPGTQTAGGTAGSPSGNPGALGQGGAGGLDTGGGGGGGLYGGGGGGDLVFDENGDSPAAGGGGGGSSLVPTGGTQALTTAAPSVSISYLVPPATPTVTTTPSAATGIVGITPISDTATLTDGYSPSGTVTFDLYGPDDSTCSAAAVFTSDGTLSGGVATSGTFTPTALGTYYWIANYLGDADNTPASSACGEPIVISQASPTITTTPTPSEGVVGTTPISDSATLTGGDDPSGTVTFDLYGPGDSDCTGTVVFTSSSAVSGGAATSGSYTPSAPGTYYWDATYGGDTNNAGVSSGCGEPVAISQASPAITTTPTPTDGVVGTTPISDSATLTGGDDPSGTVTFDLYGPGDSDCSGTVVFTSSGAVSGGAATSGSYTPSAPGTYYWDATYGGDTNNAGVSSGCGEPVTIGRAIPTISSRPSAGGATGTGISDTATVSGGLSPTGTVSFALYGPGDTGCATNLVAGNAAFQNVALTGGAAASPSFTTTAPGTYQWVATYNGDTNNTPSAGSCPDPSEQVQITAPLPTPTPAAEPGLPNTGTPGPGAPPLPVLLIPFLIGGAVLTLGVRRQRRR